MDTSSPSFEIKSSCPTCGEENPLYTYNQNFFAEMANFISFFEITDIKTLDNINAKNMSPFMNLKLCCKARISFGQLIYFSSRNQNQIIQKKNIVSLPGPLSDGKHLGWD